MSVATLRGGKTGYAPWTRPSDWLALPTLVAGQEKVVALAAVFPNGANVFAVNCTGAYTVDWGDGTVENVASGVQRNHTYTYSSLSANDTSDGWRQAIVTITPQAANSLTFVNFGVTPTGVSAGYMQQWRDIAIVGANVTSLNIGNASGTNVSAVQMFTYVGPSALSSVSGSFRNLAFLKAIYGTQWTSGCTSMNQTFAGCGQLEILPLLDTHAVTTFNTAFQGCLSLRSIPAFNTGLVTDFTSAFQNCTNLATVPLLDTSHATTMASMFSTCLSLATIPLFVTTSVTSFASMFNGCSTLNSIPALDMSNATSTSSMFNGCVSLTTFAAALNTVKVTDFSSMFNGCTTLVTHPSMNCTAGTLFPSMFQGCSALTTISLTTPVATSMGNLAFNCTSLRTLTLGNLASIPSSAAMSQCISSTVALGSCTLQGLRFAPASTSFASQQLSAAALNALYTSLGTASGAQTLVFTGNPGSGSSTISIATAKSWTITGG